MGDKVFRIIFDFFLSYPVSTLKFRRSYLLYFSEKSAEWRDTLKPNVETGIWYIETFHQKFFGIFYSYPYHILMRRMAIYWFKKSDEMKFWKITFPGNIVKIDVGMIVSVNE